MIVPTLLDLRLCWYIVHAVPPASSLGDDSLSNLDSAVQKPSYDRTGLRRSIVHIGVGGFHRAHLATYIDELCAIGETDWSIVGSGVLAHDGKMKTVLDDQDCLYSLISRGPRETTVRVIGSIVEYVLAHPDPLPLIDQIASSDTQIVSLTITEGGYPIDDSTGQYLPDSPTAGPNSAFGILVAGLNKRRETNGGPLTVISCDNIMTNGDIARTAAIGEAARLGSALVQWIETSVTFPNSMVDRITPVTTDADRKWLTDNHAIIDEWPVVAEPFRQWVVEDAFAGDRPPLEKLDIIVTDNVEPYELMKLRLLNAGHSCLAYLAALDGIELVDEAMARPYISEYVKAFLSTEAQPVLPDVEGVDLDQYSASLIDRFSNPAIGDQIARLCLDGTAKFPKFLLPTIEGQLATDGSVKLSTLALAGWCQYLLGETLDGEAIEPSPDPLLAQAIDYAKQSLDKPASFLGFSEVFGSLGHNEAFQAAFSDALTNLRTNGLRSSIAAALEL